MKVQTRLSLFNTVVFGVIFSIISIFIYTLYSQNAKKNIYTTLKKTAQITAFFYLEEDELNNDDFDKVRKEFYEITTNSFYQIYNENDSVSYGSSSLHVSPNILMKIRKSEGLTFSDSDFLCYGIFYEDNQGDFVIIVRESKDVLNSQLNMLLWILIPAFFAGIIAIILFSRWIANVAYLPFRKTIKQVNNISTNNLNIQISSPGTKDELQDLVDTFNELLTKISETFVIQKNFVRYVSHEFKTPLASMLGNLEVFSMKERTPQEYEQLSLKIIQQIHQLEDILNTLIVISDLREDIPSTTSTRIDELIWEIIQKISQQYPNPVILVNINVYPEDEELLHTTKDPTQLLMAFFNLIENAVKYSQNKPIEINPDKTENNRLSIQIKDQGIGIPKDQIRQISKPFYRADNATEVKGYGIGLSIALKILEKNNIKYIIKSEMNIGTTISMII